MGAAAETASPHPRTPAYMSVFCGWGLAFMVLCGKLQDFLFGGHSRRTRPGYAPISDQQEAFFTRRMYRRMHDCWNRPIASAPGAWIDIMNRTNISGRSMHTSLELTGGTTRALNLGSYNYLGFAAQDDYCTPRVLDTLGRWGVSGCSSRTEGGSTALHAELEALVADYVGKEAAIAYGMGFATNSASIPALAGPGTLVLSDALNHCSIVAGVKSSGARVKVFRHNDIAHLEKLLRFSIAEGQPRTRRPWKKIIILVEGIYSMEGETCRLAEIVALKKRYKAYLYLDEAHSIGALGRTGRGLCEHAGVDPADVDVLMGTFTKSFGSCGGYIAGSAALIAHLRAHSPAHLYATAIAPGAVQQIISALRLITGADGSGRGAAKIAALHDNANYFRARLRDMGLHVLGDWDSPIMPIMLYHTSFLPMISRLCLARHVALVVVAFPATPLLLGRCRVCISAAHSREELDYALDTIWEATRLLRLHFNGRPRSWRCTKALAGSGKALLGAGASGLVKAAAA